MLCVAAQGGGVLNHGLGEDEPYCIWVLLEGVTSVFVKCFRQSHWDVARHLVGILALRMGCPDLLICFRL